MRLSRFAIRQFRNLQQVEFDASSGLNLISGQNASGKTSLLEAIYYLSHIRSFRTQHVADLVQHGEDQFELFASLHKNSTTRVPVGIRRSRHKLVARMDQQNVRRVADIAARFPVLAIHPDSYRLITAGPGERRQYMDWGVFHVEHDFLPAWQQYRRALHQRNSALRSGQPARMCSVWDRELVEKAVRIDRYRQAYFQALKPFMQPLMADFFSADAIQIQYQRGWSQDQELSDLLAQGFERDRKRGHTGVGPQRADLNIKVNGQSAQTGISRGQQKMLVALLRLAQAMHYSASSQKACVLLYDDLPAELDSENRHKVLALLREMKVQLFVTAIEPEQVDTEAWEHKKMFHVEQGRLTELV